MMDLVKIATTVLIAAAALTPFAVGAFLARHEDNNLDRIFKLTLGVTMCVSFAVVIAGILAVAFGLMSFLWRL